MTRTEETSLLEEGSSSGSDRWEGSEEEGEGEGEKTRHDEELISFNSCALCLSLFSLHLLYWLCTATQSCQSHSLNVNSHYINSVMGVHAS